MFAAGSLKSRKMTPNFMHFKNYPGISFVNLTVGTYANCLKHYGGPQIFLISKSRDGFKTQLRNEGIITQ